MVLAVIEGSEAWQRIFLIGAVVLLLWHAIRGWSLGPARQFVHIAALLAAYLAALVLGGPLVPMLRPVIALPDFLLRVLAGAGAGLIVYLVLLFFGALFFKRTGQQPGGFLRVVYGFFGSVLGLVSGCLLLWILVMGLRLIGTVAEARMEAAEADRKRHGGGTAEERARDLGVGPERGAEQAGEGAPVPLLEFAVRARKSVELGPAEPVIAAVDVIPDEVYALLGDLARVVASVESAQRFLEYPGAAELAAHPKIAALQKDPEIARLIGAGEYLALLRNEQVIDVSNDPEVAERLRTFELRKAIDHALKRPTAARSEPPAPGPSQPRSPRPTR